MIKRRGESMSWLGVNKFYCICGCGICESMFMEFCDKWCRHHGHYRYGERYGVLPEMRDIVHVWDCRPHAGNIEDRWIPIRGSK